MAVSMQETVRFENRILVRNRLQIGALDLAALTLKNNVAHFTGGGLRSEDTAADVILRGVTIIGNRSPIGGGAAFVAVSNVTVTSNKGIKTVVENNTASVGGGIHYDCSEASYFVLTVSRRPECYRVQAGRGVLDGGCAVCSQSGIAIVESENSEALNSVPRFQSPSRIVLSVQS